MLPHLIVLADLAPCGYLYHTIPAVLRLVHDIMVISADEL